MSSAGTFSEDTAPFVDIIWQKGDSIGQDRYSKTWFFIDETYMVNGPYDTEHEARISLVLYCWYCLEDRQYGTLPRHAIKDWKTIAELNKL